MIRDAIADRPVRFDVVRLGIETGGEDDIDDRDNSWTKDAEPVDLQWDEDVEHYVYRSDDGGPITYLPQELSPDRRGTWRAAD